MDNEKLTVREMKVLEAVVRHYILSAAPMGSRVLSKQLDLGLSAATIRNIMGDLEEKGYVAQPHTSAGRVPTDRGYRLYVDRMMEHSGLAEPLKDRIRSIIVASEPTDLHLLMEATTKALSIVSDQLGIVLAPKISKGIFRHIHIFAIEPHRYVLHMAIDSGFVRTLTIELESDIGPLRLEQACSVLNERLYGMRLSDLTEHEDEVLRNIEPANLGVIRLFVPSIKKMLERENETEMVYTEGETNIVLKPDFQTPDGIGAVVEVLGERKMLMHLVDTTHAEPGQVVVSIGAENAQGAFGSFSVVKARYQVGSLEGSVGVLGPKRMPYPFLVATVDYTAKLLGDLHH
jgi:heat-inducible transcriptional repressor